MKDFEQAEYGEILRHLLTTMNLCAPTGAVQRKFVDELHEMERANETRRNIVKTLTGRLYDGLAFGNWPGQLPA